MNRSSIFVGLVLVALLSAIGCKPEGAGTAIPAAQPAYRGAGPLQVTCTTGMVADLVRNIAGPRAEIKQLMGAGVDPHLYKSSPGDIAALSSADVVFYSGLHLEGKMTDLFTQLATTKPVIAVAEKIDEAKLLHDGGTHDPHVWFDVALWKQAGEQVLAALVKFDPAEAANYQARAQQYFTQLDELDQFCREQLAQIPADQRVMVTAHDAFRYFGKAYGIEVRGIQGVSTESEAGVKGINELVDFLVQRKIKAIFVETSVSEENVKSLLEGCRAQNHTVTIGGQLYSDAMGEPGTPAGTYDGMIRHNVTTIVHALK
ncbi:Periplasmic zinc-binding protein TroA precursor [Anatilimnocola aggregata]|uniref:Periplasmic zinc-binding protein TroA n=1 Tax=Anatilimnocola aggregata TaxID=2528021 RepID=A0A517YBL5_9BACT|nr:zinc ABC transporter substrate-binding protein [Anatilimnocola aggregata]QDU27638.1 Periplasmic zinc-binding protein TroA precursor [Anatilimnocola aggregata]